jgi:hypothetical protein
MRDIGGNVTPWAYQQTIGFSSWPLALLDALHHTSQQKESKNIARLES